MREHEAKDAARTRASLLRRVKNPDDRTGWREFDHIYRGVIYAFAVRAGLTHEEAEDAVQETLSDLARKLPNFNYDPARGSFKALLRKLTRWRVIEQFQRRGPVSRPSAPHPEEDSQTETLHRVPDPASLDLDQIWDQEWGLQLIRAAENNVKRKIDPKKFQIFDLYVNKEVAPQRVAETFGIDVAQVYLLKSRIQEMIRQEALGLAPKFG